MDLLFSVLIIIIVIMSLDHDMLSYPNGMFQLRLCESVVEVKWNTSKADLASLLRFMCLLLFL